MHLSIIIPVYNEIKTIEDIIAKVVSVNISKEIIIVDDGSTDGTAELLKSGKISYPEIVKILYHSINQGKGQAIRTALPYISGEFVTIQDGDLEYDPNDLNPMLSLALTGRKVVYGSRILGHNPKSYYSFYLGGRILSFLTNLLYRSHITDEPTCYKMIEKDLLMSFDLTCKRFEFCPELTSKILKSGTEISEIPITYKPRSKKEGKKITWRTGIKHIFFIFKYRFRKS